MASANNATTSKFPIDGLERRVEAQADDEVTKPIERAPVRRRLTRARSRRIAFPAVVVDDQSGDN